MREPQLSQGRQHALRGLQIGRIGPFDKLFEHRLQKRPAVLASSLIGKQICQIDRRAQRTRPVRIPRPPAATSTL
jgi:hypothetical protein